MSDINHTTDSEPLSPFTDPGQVDMDGENHELSDIGEATQDADPRQNDEPERDAGSDALDQ